MSMMELMFSRSKARRPGSHVLYMARKQEDDISLPAFLAVVGRGFAAGGLVAGAARFLSYGLGMASVLVALSVGLAFFKEGLLKWLRGALPYVQTASTLLLILAGAYVIFYRWTAKSVR